MTLAMAWYWWLAIVWPAASLVGAVVFWCITRAGAQEDELRARLLRRELEEYNRRPR